MTNAKNGWYHFSNMTNHLMQKIDADQTHSIFSAMHAFTLFNELVYKMKGNSCYCIPLSIVSIALKYNFSHNTFLWCSFPRQLLISVEYLNWQWIILACAISVHHTDFWRVSLVVVYVPIEKCEIYLVRLSWRKAMLPLQWLVVMLLLHLIRTGQPEETLRQH